MEVTCKGQRAIFSHHAEAVPRPATERNDTIVLQVPECALVVPECCLDNEWQVPW